MLLSAVFLMAAATTAFGSETGTWGMSEDGKNWMYFYSPDNPAKDEWIEEDGKVYYVDSKGRMKTGWVTDKEDGNKYYMGADGAKCFNMITPDDHYVGPEGTVLKSFDTYRKTVSKELGKFWKDKSYKALDRSQLPGFQLVDLNGDGYRDVLVMNRVENPDRVVMAAIWDPATGKLVLSAEADLNGEETSTLMFHPDTQSVWLSMSHPDGGMDFFQLRDGGVQFEQIWSFQTEADDWGDTVCYVNRVKVEQEEWEETLRFAKEEMGAIMTPDLLLLDEENVTQAVNQMPEEELLQWQ